MVDKLLNLVYFPGRYILQVPFVKADLDAYQNLPVWQSFRFFLFQNMTEISAKSRIWDI